MDVGVLINSGNGGAAQEFFHMAATSKLRVYVSFRKPIPAPQRPA